MSRTVTVTGTRATGHRDITHYHELFTAYLAPFTEASSRFYVGGASGIDTLALRWLATRTSASITVTVPRTVADQPPDAQDAVTAAQDAGKVTDVVELGASDLNTAAYHARNRWMVDRSAFVIGFPRGDDHQSGTWYTLDYAAQQGKPRLIVPA